jgi:hypothetical protein
MSFCSTACFPAQLDNLDEDAHGNFLYGASLNVQSRRARTWLSLSTLIPRSPTD